MKSELNFDDQYSEGFRVSVDLDEYDITDDFKATHIAGVKTLHQSQGGTGVPYFEISPVAKDPKDPQVFYRRSLPEGHAQDWQTLDGDVWLIVKDEELIEVLDEIFDHCVQRAQEAHSSSAWAAEVYKYEEAVEA